MAQNNNDISQYKLTSDEINRAAAHFNKHIGNRNVTFAGHEIGFLWKKFILLTRSIVNRTSICRRGFCRLSTLFVKHAGSLTASPLKLSAYLTTLNKRKRRKAKWVDLQFQQLMLSQRLMTRIPQSLYLYKTSITNFDCRYF